MLSLSCGDHRHWYAISFSGDGKLLGTIPESGGTVVWSCDSGEILFEAPSTLRPLYTPVEVELFAPDRPTRRLFSSAQYDLINPGTNDTGPSKV